MLSGCSKFIFDGEASLYSPCVLFLIYFLKVGLIFSLCEFVGHCKLILFMKSI